MVPTASPLSCSRSLLGCGGERSAAGKAQRSRTRAAARLCAARSCSVRSHFASGEVTRSELFYASAHATPTYGVSTEVVCGKKKKLAKKHKKAAEERGKRLELLVSSLNTLETEAQHNLRTQELLTALAQEVAAINMDVKQQAELMLGSSSSSSSSSSSDDECKGKKKKTSAADHKKSRQQLVAGNVADTKNRTILEQARAIANEDKQDRNQAIDIEAVPVNAVHSKATIAICTSKKCLRQGALHLYSALEKAVEVRSGRDSTGVAVLSSDRSANLSAIQGSQTGSEVDTSLNAILDSVLTLEDDVSKLPPFQIEVRESKCLGACGKGPCVRLKASGEKPKDSVVHRYVDVDEVPTLLKMCEPPHSPQQDMGTAR